jgi:hypothetical protein
MNKVTSKERDIITIEITKSVHNLIRGCETLDMDMAFSPFFNSPDFLMMGTDGSLCDYDTYLKNNIDYLENCSEFKLTTYDEEINVLDSETAIFSWAYRAEAKLKTGEKDIVDKAGASFIFHNFSNEWKVIYYHESSLPPIRVPDVD